MTVAEQLLEDPEKRRTLKTVGAALTGATLAGCARNTGSDNNGYTDDDNGYGDDDDGDNGGTGGSTRPEYSLHVDISHGSNEIDLTDADYADLEVYVERELNGETEKLGAEHIEITGIYTIRNHEEYSEEFLEEQGLYKDIQQLENMEERLWRIQKNDLLAGNTLLNFQVNFQDPEHGHNQKYNVEADLQIQKTREETKQDIWIDNEPLWKELRLEHVENELDRTTALNDGSWDTWREIAEAVEQEIDLNQPTEDMLNDLNYEWAERAEEGVGMKASGQTSWLAHTIEYISHNNSEVEELWAYVHKNRTHDTAGAYNDTKAWDVESSGTYVWSPPSGGHIHVLDPEQTSLMNPEENMRHAQTAVQTMIELSLESMDIHMNDYMPIGRNARLDILEHIRESSTGRLPDQTLTTLRNYGLSKLLSPQTDLELTTEEINL